jgi:hypothetical protein
MLVRFKIACTYASGNSDAREFQAGEVVDLRDDLAKRWIARDAAEAYTAPQSKPAEEGWGGLAGDDAQGAAAPAGKPSGASKPSGKGKA